MVIMFISILLVLVESKQTGGLPPGARCITTTRTGDNVRCRAGLDCVIVHHGIPKTNIENMGTCQKLKRTTLQQCSVEYCSKVGHTATCVDTYKPFIASKCDAFATRVDGGRKPNCSFECGSKKCVPGGGEMKRTNFGKWYCGLCELKRASCSSGFREFGPFVHGSTSDGGECSTTDRQMKPCKSKSVCLVESFGKGQADTGGTHSKGKCVPKGQFMTCTLDFCSQNGESAYCQTPLDKVMTKCGVWAGRTDFGLKPDCNHRCVRGYCQIPAVVDKDGKEYCSPCHMRKASCMTNFKIHGKIPPQIAQNKWLCSTRSPTSGETKCKKGSSCLIKHFGYAPLGFSNAGICTPRSGEFPSCTTDVCKNNNKKRCITIDTKDWTTCKYWRNRSDAGE